MEYRSPRGLPVDYAVLGLLLEGPAHGYDLQQRFHGSLGPVWRVAWSQLYSVLHALEERGWIGSSESRTSGGPPRHTYAISAAGRRAFYEWAAAPVARLRDLRVEYLAKLFFLRKHRPEELEPLLTRQSEALKQAMEGLSSSAGDPWIAYIALSFRRHQTESAIEWIHEVRESLKKEGEGER